MGVAEMWGWELAGWHFLTLEASFLHLRILWGRRLSSISAPSGLGRVVSLGNDEVVGLLEGWRDGEWPICLRRLCIERVVDEKLFLGRVAHLS